MGNIIDNIKENIEENCLQFMRDDVYLKSTEKEFYKALEEGCEQKEQIKIEEIFSKYTARLMELAYLQGIKDFNSLFEDLKQDVITIHDTSI